MGEPVYAFKGKKIEEIVNGKCKEAIFYSEQLFSLIN